MDAARHPLKVTVYSDYICPFCYVGDRRLRRLAERFPLDITWRPVEIHPDTPPEGMPLERLGYPPEVWEKMMAHLGNMAAEEGIALAERHFTTNSHNALLLAEAARELGEGVFERVHEGLFHAFFCEGRNIGEAAVLADIATRAGMGREAFDRALADPRHEDALRENFVAARQDGVTGVPTLVINGHRVQGAVPLANLLLLAEELVEG